MEVKQDLPTEVLYLSQKTTHMAAPGTKLNDLYYSRMNSTVELVEATANLGRYRQTLSSSAFGSSSNSQIPNGSFLSSTYLHLELPALTANQSLCRGWGIACIREISFLFGSSNVPELTLSGASLAHILSLQSETSEKFDEQFSLAGYEYLSPPLAPIGGDVPRITADILLPFPWSSLAGMIQKKPYDTSLLNNPITVNITFKDSSSIYGGTDARPSGFTRAELSFRQLDLTNKDIGLKVKLMKNPDLVYNYPFLHHQSYSSQKFAGIIRSSGTKVNIPLLSFINADLVGMVISVIKTDSLLSIGGNSPSPFAYDDIEDVEIKYNGQTVYYGADKSWKLYNMIGNLGSSAIKNSVIRSGALAPFVSDPVDSYPLIVDFSRLRPAVFNNQYQNTFRIPNQTMDISFNTTTSDTYQLFATYIYNGVVETVSNGETRIFLA